MSAWVIPNVLSTSYLSKLKYLLESRNFEPGVKTAQGYGVEVKNNSQLPITNDTYAECSNLVLTSLKTCQPWVNRTFPDRMSALLFNSYKEGMYYKPHVDAGTMAHPSGRVRTDISCSLLLSDPSDYEGGELVITQPDGTTREFKVDAGSAVVYNGGMLHEVRTVTKGERLACVFWVQSLFASPEHRHLLYMLDDARAETPNIKLDVLRENLRRMWN